MLALIFLSELNKVKVNITALTLAFNNANNERENTTTRHNQVLAGN